MQKLILLCPGVPVLAISGHDENVFGERALQAGARGSLAKSAGAEKIIPAVRAILRGEIYAGDAPKPNSPLSRKLERHLGFYARPGSPVARGRETRASRATRMAEPLRSRRFSTCAETQIEAS